MTKKLCILFTIVMFLFSSTAFAFDKSYTLPVDEFEDLVVKSGGVKLNNFTLSRDTDTFSDLNQIRVSISAKNKSKKDQFFGVSVVGMDKSGKILWATVVEPLFGKIDAGKSDTYKNDVAVPKGTLKKTKKVFLRVYGTM